MNETPRPLSGHIVYLAPKQFQKCVVPYIASKIEVSLLVFLPSQKTR